ncbi:MAG: hypothetical protein LBR22_02400 [Desulfovibrio sp.]|jgi:hypothetical protein|nr:hypothetical protein [Desulfovibrio sp.]
MKLDDSSITVINHSDYEEWSGQAEGICCPKEFNGLFWGESDRIPGNVWRVDDMYENVASMISEWYMSSLFIRDSIMHIEDEEQRSEFDKLIKLTTDYLSLVDSLIDVTDPGEIQKIMEDCKTIIHNICNESWGSFTTFFHACFCN